MAASTAVSHLARRAERGMSYFFLWKSECMHGEVRGAVRCICTHKRVKRVTLGPECVKKRGWKTGASAGCGCMRCGRVGQCGRSRRFALSQSAHDPLPLLSPLHPGCAAERTRSSGISMAEWWRARKRKLGQLAGPFL